MQRYRGLWVRDDVDRQVLDEVAWHYDPGFDVLHEPALIIDIGTHIGGFIDQAKKRFPQAAVIGIEPDVRNLGLAYLNVADQDGVTLLDGAVGYYRGRQRVQRDNERTCNTCIKERLQEGHHWGNVVHHIYSLESLIMTPVDLIKFDCEDAEYHILPNVQPKTWQRVKAIVGEYHGSRQQFDTRARPFLQDHFEISHYPPYNQHLGFFLGINKHAH